MEVEGEMRMSRWRAAERRRRRVERLSVATQVTRKAMSSDVNVTAMSGYMNMSRTLTGYVYVA